MAIKASRGIYSDIENLVLWARILYNENLFRVYSC
jgi:hypothetical protein